MIKSPRKNNLLKAILASKWFPGILQYPTALVFALIIYELLFGPLSPGENFGTAMTWVLWWPIIPLVFLLFGRLWCAICPFATLSDLVQKLVGNNRPVPLFLKRYGIWIIDAVFILITWGDHIWGVVESPRGSVILLLMLITGVIASGAFLERRGWCRYLCFLGGLAGNYSRTGMLELRATPEKCAKCKVQACYKGNSKVPGCPLFEFPKTMDSSATCNLCGNCVKTCPNDSIRLSVRVPSKELWFIKKPRLEESFLAIVIMGIVFVQNITMLDIGARFMALVESVTGISSYPLTFTITFIIAMALPVLALFLTGWLSSTVNGESAMGNFIRFGYALIPLDLAGHMAHNLFHLLAEGNAVLITGLSLFGVNLQKSTALAGNETIQMLQFSLIGLGALLSLYTAYRVAKSNFTVGKVVSSLVPVACFILLLTFINLYLFTLPMAHRM
ncbi:MAG: 4Fe-4S binding protein [Syntrophomonadaceae bacterium]|nr:4Fe-4S binding protein [Syntrophomonadaceae bacterium]